MELLIVRRIKNILLGLLFIGALITNQSCSKDEQDLGSAGVSEMSFVVDSEIGFDGGSANTTQSTSNMNTSSLKTVLAKQIFDSKDNMMYQVSQQELVTNNLKATVSASNSNASENSSALKAVAPVYPNNYAPAGFPSGRAMTKDVTFRVLIYDANGNYVNAIDGVVGSATLPKLVIDQGKSYTWYAYSYYSTDPLPAIPVSERNNPKLAVENEDFLFATGNFTAAQGTGIVDNKVTVKFKHTMAMIELTTYTTGFNAKADLTKFVGTGASRPFIQTQANMLQGGKFSLKTGAFDPASTYTINTAVDVNRRDNYAFSTSYNNTSYHGFLFTVPGADNDVISNFKFNISNFLTLDYSATPKVMNKNDFTFTVSKGKGKFTRFSVMPIDAGIVVPLTGSAVGTGPTNWARGDLYYDDTAFGFLAAEGFTRYQHRPKLASTYMYPSTYKPNGVTTPITTANYGATYYIPNYKQPVGSGSTSLGNPCTDIMPNLTWPDQPTGTSTTLNSTWVRATVQNAMSLANLINTFPSRVSYNFNAATKSIVVNVVPNGGTVTDDWSQVLTFELKGYAQPINATVNNNYAMVAASIPYTTSSTVTGYGYFWLDIGGSYTNPSGQTVPSVNYYLKLALDNTGKVTASVHTDYQGTPQSGIQAFEAGITTRTAMPIRCVRSRLYGS
ncbi:hypothetical protein LZQ00_17205 [Sphingobacterium sp. SRCM116780]|uniref:hypothetical protein n=1 Tax=Sphingobacterium sp. SRCM116780 TaxID=2907623 RepID=UPI001F472FB5|nr:hypothetical protein [Sphingobacterium sp. SRCM116780]UIR55988.1 hypothetical protein LZQ00_17205 [Sphingobacterium sp. SRCM116780]